MSIGAARRFRQAGPDLVSQGLRTLELCIDNLTPVFLDPIMAPVIGDLMQALWKVRHLALCENYGAEPDLTLHGRCPSSVSGRCSTSGRSRTTTATTTALPPCASWASWAGATAGC